MDKYLLNKVKNVANDILLKNNIKNVKIFFNEDSTNLGQCSWYENTDIIKSISFNIDFLNLNQWSKINYVINHECAHAIDIKNRKYTNHDEIWQNIFNTLNKDKRIKYAYMPKTKYVGNCINCNTKSYLNKKELSYCYLCINKSIPYNLCKIKFKLNNTNKLVKIEL